MPKTSGITVSAVIDTALHERIRALRIDGPNILSASTVIKAALIRGVAQLELERSMGRSVLADPLKLLSGEEG